MTPHLLPVVRGGALHYTLLRWEGDPHCHPRWGPASDASPLPWQRERFDAWDLSSHLLDNLPADFSGTGDAETGPFLVWPERRERVLYSQSTGPNQLNHPDDFSRPALRHGILNSLFQVALYLPS